MEIIDRLVDFVQKAPYHSDVEIDAHPIHPLCMLMVVLGKKKYNVAVALCFPYLVHVGGVHLSPCVPSQDGHG